LSNIIGKYIAYILLIYWPVNMKIFYWIKAVEYWRISNSIFASKTAKTNNTIKYYNEKNYDAKFKISRLLQQNYWKVFISNICSTPSFLSPYSSITLVNNSKIIKISKNNSNERHLRLLSKNFSNRTLHYWSNNNSVLQTEKKVYREKKTLF